MLKQYFLYTDKKISHFFVYIHECTCRRQWEAKTLAFKAVTAIATALGTAGAGFAPHRS